MPTTAQEATTIVEICQEYIDLEDLKELFNRLHTEVGEKSDNSSLKVSLAMMKMLVDPPIVPSIKLKMALYLVVFVHAVLCLGVAASFIVVPFMAPWYIALPIDVFIWFFCTNRIECKITNLENKLRKELGMKPIGGFVGHYFLKPIRSLIAHFRGCTRI